MFRGIRPRTLWAAVLSIVLMVAIVFAVWHAMLSRPSRHGSVVFEPFAEGSQATVAYAGRFPAKGSPSLPGPKGMATDGERLYVALADAGAVGVFDYSGARIATLTIPPAKGAPVAYPVDVAVMADGRVAVVDASGSRVIFMDPQKPDAEVVTLTVKSGAALRQPTAVGYGDGKLYVADSSDGSIKIFDNDGALLRVIANDLKPRLTYVGGLLATEGALWVSDSNTGRVVTLDPNRGRLLGSLQRRLDLPRGLAIDSAGRMFVAETFARVVSIFGPDGATVVDTVADERTESIHKGGSLAAPEAIVWDAANSRLYVSDSAEGCIKVYNVREAVR